MMNNPLISIIVPVYGAEKYLHCCLDSIIDQTFTDWECILVDDGSKDNGGRICDEYAARDSRFKVFHKINGGVSSARNFGLEKACGEWCCFIDSDDWIEVSYLQNYIDTQKQQDDLILQSYYKDVELSRRSNLVSLPEELMNSASELVFFLEYTNVYNGYLWHRLFKMSIIKQFNIIFPIEVSFAEDGIFCLNYILHTKYYRLTKKAGYHHMVRSNTLTSTGKNLPLEKSLFLLNKYSFLIYQIIEKDHPNLRIIRGLRLLLNRWIGCWLLENIKTEQMYYKLSSYLPSICWREGCKINVAKEMGLTLSLIFKNISCPPSFLHYKVFKFLVVLYKVEYRIKRRVLSLK